MRMAAIVGSSLTSGPVKGAGAGRSTYSGRAMPAGTARRGLTTPWTRVPRGALVVGVVDGAGEADMSKVYRGGRTPGSYSTSGPVPGVQAGESLPTAGY